MTATVAKRSQQAARLVTAVGLLVIGAGLAALADQGRVTADFVGSLHLPGTPTPDVSTLDGLVAAASVEALVAVAIAIAVLVRGGRTAFGAGAVWAALALGTTIYAIATRAELEAIPVGPVQVSPVAAASVIAIAAVISIGSAAIGWHGTPAETHAQAVHMPPPTHQA